MCGLRQLGRLRDFLSMGGLSDGAAGGDILKPEMWRSVAAVPGAQPSRGAGVHLDEFFCCERVNG